MFCRMNYLKYRANLLRVTLNAQRPSEPKLLRIERLLREATRLRNEIVHANVRLVVSIVKQFADERNSFDDLLSEGINCLIKAVDKFDFDRGFRFSTYATRAVRREVFRLVQKQYRERVRFTTGAGTSFPSSWMTMRPAAVRNAHETTGSHHAGHVVASRPARTVHCPGPVRVSGSGGEADVSAPGRVVGRVERASPTA